jgi:hypothetical protein
MTTMFPKNDPNRLQELSMVLHATFKKTAKDEGFPADQMISAISLAAAVFAEEHGIDPRRYVELQAAFIQMQADQRKAKT